MLYAVEPKFLNSIWFLTEHPGEGEWTVDEVDEIDIPINYDVWHHGDPAPEQVLCRSEANPKRFKIFKYSQDIDRAKFRPTGKSFAGVLTKETFLDVVDRLPREFWEEAPSVPPAIAP